MSKKGLRKKTFGTVNKLIYSLLYLLFYFNPWILELQWNGIFFKAEHIPTLQVIIFPTIIISLWFSALVNWRVGSVKDDKEDTDKEDNEKKSKVKKIPKAPSKKTLGMINKTWISLCLNLMIIVGIFWVVMIILELIVTGKKFINLEIDDIVLFLQGFGFIDVIVLFPMIYDCFKDKYKKDTPECYRKQALFTGLSTVFIFFYFFNPWTLECFRTAELFYEYFLFFSIVELIGIPIILVSLSFYTWIYWRMSKVKPDYDGDEPYLVIYGGGESSTKMIIVE
uniref:Serpentine receptor class gamma n=1 Tax=Caenorhabditis tropicalis TaxID=1561998 RepID=A0A1I7UGJ4_9PELO